MAQDGVVLGTSAMVEIFDRDGFLFLERVLDPRQIAAAQQGVAWAMASVAGDYRWIKQRTYEWHREHPIFVEVIEHPLVLAFAREIFGQDFHLIAAQCSRNTREDMYAPGVTHIHQDGVFFPQPQRQTPGVPLERYGFSAMFYMQDTPLQMGPTELVPGFHRDSRMLTNADVTEEMVWRRTMPAGSLLIFNHRCWHRGAINQTDRPRDLITNAYARPEVEKSQLTLKQPDGTARYIEPTDLLREGSDMLRMLLRAR